MRPVPDRHRNGQAPPILEIERKNLVSGGGSSLLALPAGDIPMADLKAVTRELLASGAPIQDMNTVRKQTPPPPAPPSKEEALLTEIRDLLARR